MDRRKVRRCSLLLESKDTKRVSHSSHLSPLSLPLPSSSPLPSLPLFPLPFCSPLLVNKSDCFRYRRSGSALDFPSSFRKLFGSVALDGEIWYFLSISLFVFLYLPSSTPTPPSLHLLSSPLFSSSLLLKISNYIFRFGRGCYNDSQTIVFEQTIFVYWAHLRSPLPLPSSLDLFVSLLPSFLLPLPSVLSSTLFV